MNIDQLISVGPTDRSLTVGTDSRWIRIGDAAPRDLVRFGSSRRLLEILVQKRFDAPNTAVSANALIELVWPGESMRYSAGLLRVYAAVSRLRQLGLGAILVTRDDGYLVDANVRVMREPRDETPRNVTWQAAAIPAAS